MLRITIKKIAFAAALVAGGLTISGGTCALGQAKLGPAAPVTYDNKYELYGGLNFMNFMAGDYLPKRMDFGGGEIEGTYWVTPKWGAVAEFRGEAGTTPVNPIAQSYGIHRPLVYMNMVLFGAQYRWAQNQHVAVDLHAYGGPAVGVFNAGTAGAGPGDLKTNSTQNAQIAGLYSNHTAPIFALGGSVDMNRSKNWAIRLSPDLILDEFGSGTREFFAISGGVVYRFPVKKK
jgi:hypothetical protein